MFYPGVPEIARHYPWGVAADTHAIARVPGFPVTQRQTEPRVRLSSKESRMKFANAPNRDRKSMGIPPRGADQLVNAVNNLPEEPGPAFCLVDPDLNQTGRRHVVVVITQFVEGTERCRQLPVVSV